MNVRKVLSRFLLILFLAQVNRLSAQARVPTPDHIVIAILENHGYDQIIGSSATPYINALARDTSSALFTASYGVTHPSQPNYLALYSGSTQGVTDDLVPAGNPFTTPNLGRQLLDHGNTFVTFSEDLPQVGYNGELLDYYARRHNPAANWMGNGINQIPVTTDQPFTAFPSGNFALLPTVSFVCPNTINDMHDGTDPERIMAGDTWIATYLDSYVQWAKTTNNLFILTFDEDDGSATNQVVTVFSGKMVQQGQYPETINHYSVLHTIEKMYGLPAIGDSITYAPITDCWKGNSSNGIPGLPDSSACLIYPNPVTDFFYVRLLNYQGAIASIYNLKGELIRTEPLEEETTEINTGSLAEGLYMVKIQTKVGVILKKFSKK